MVEEEVQKLTWLVAPEPVKEPVPESSEQMTLPDESVVNLPPLLYALQLYPLNWTADTTIKELPIPTLPTRLDMPVTFKVDSAAAEVTVKDEPMETLPDEVRVDA